MSGRVERMQEKKLNVRDGRLIYREQAQGVAIAGFEGNASRLTVPALIEGKPVTEVYKKAFFNCRYLRFLTLPGTLEKIDSWAFAHCPQLERVELPRRSMALGKDLFIGSDRLREIALFAPEEMMDGCGCGCGCQEAAQTEAEEDCILCNQTEIARLLAAAATRMEDPYLFCIEEAGTVEWLKKWDARMMVLMHEDDNDGYEKQVLAGEEDYEKTDQVRFRKLKRQAKVRLAFLRLLHSCGLTGETRRELEEYLQAHTKGCRSEETWEVVWQEHGDEKPYYELFAELGCVTEENFAGLLTDIGENHTEMKAYLMRYKEEKLGYQDFFDTLSLDGWE